MEDTNKDISNFSPKSQSECLIEQKSNNNLKQGEYEIIIPSFGTWTDDPRKLKGIKESGKW